MKFFNSYGGVIELMPPFNMREMTKVDQDDPYFESTIYNVAVGTNRLNPVTEIERAISRLYIVENVSGIKGFGGYGFAENGDFYADYYDGSTTEYVDQLTYNGDFSEHRRIVMKISKGEDSKLKLSGVCVNEYGAQAEYVVGDSSKGGHSSSAVIYALLAFSKASYLNGRLEGADAMNYIYKHYSDMCDAIDSNNYPQLHKSNLALDADIYTLIKYPEKVEAEFLDPNSLPFDTRDFTGDALEELRLSDIPELNIVWGPSSVLSGEQVKSKSVSIEVTPKVKTVGDVINSKMFDLGVSLTEEEKELIPTGFDSFICDPILLDTANEIKASRFDPRPCRNIMWTGESGTGKTTSAMILAGLLQLPYYSMNLSSDKLSSDILTSCLPNNKKVTSKDIEDMLSSFPSDFEIQMDPESAYRQITGEEKPGATESDIRRAMSKKILDIQNRASDFMYVDSPFVTAYRKGGVIELQECNSAKAQILKALNEALDDTSVIHLPTGEVVHRNENCIVVVTANIGAGYRGVEDFSNDFIARMDQHDRFELPEDEELIERVVDRSGYENRDNIRKMIKTMKAIQKVLLDIRGDYGSCSPRALYSWARKTKNCGKPYFAGLKTIVGLATQNPEEEVELIAQLELYFSKTDVA